VAVTGLALLAPTAAWAEVKTFECGQTNVYQSWHDAARWSPNGVPGPGDDVVLACAASITRSAEARSLDVAPWVNVEVRGADTVLRVGAGASDWRQAFITVADGAEAVLQGTATIGGGAYDQRGRFSLGDGVGDDGVLTVEGTLTVATGAEAYTGRGHGTLVVAPGGRLIVDWDGTTPFAPNVDTYGTVEVRRGQLASHHEMLVLDGVVDIAPGASTTGGAVVLGGVVRGAGTMWGDVIVAGGVLEPGPGGDLRIAGSAAIGPDATLRVTPTATPAAALRVDGGIELAGPTLAIQPGAAPTVGDERLVVHAEWGAVGGFGALTGGAAPGGTWALAAREDAVPFTAQLRFQPAQLAPPPSNAAVVPPAPPARVAPSVPPAASVAPATPAQPAAVVALRALTRATVRGAARAGQRLRCGAPSWSIRPASVRYVWLRDGARIGRRSGATYTVRRADEGHRLACRATAVGVSGTTATSTSRPVRVALPARR